MLTLKFIQFEIEALLTLYHSLLHAIFGINTVALLSHEYYITMYCTLYSLKGYALSKAIEAFTASEMIRIPNIIFAFIYNLCKMA